VTAYNGAAGLLNSKAILTVAAALHNVEAYHAGGVRSILNERKAVMLDGASIGTIVNAISVLRDGNASVQDAGITSVSMPLILAPADSNAFVYARTAAQVGTCCQSSEHD
jgi:Ferritin-like domain